MYRHTYVHVYMYTDTCVSYSVSAVFSTPTGTELAAEVLATQRARSSTHLVAPLRHNANGSGSQLRVCSENAN